MVLLLQPMLAIVWARLVVAEALSPLQWTGVAVVLGGILVLAVRGTVEIDVRPVSAGAGPGS